MCFRPPELVVSKTCPKCGKGCDPEAATCDACGTVLEDSPLDKIMAAQAAGGAPGAPKAPGAPAAPKAPGVPPIPPAPRG